MLAAGHHVERLLDTDDARQALRAARAGQKAEVDLGQPALRRRHGDPVVAAQRDLEAAAQRGAMDRRDEWLACALDRILDLDQARRGRRLAELGDVGAGDERLAVADEHDRLGLRIGDGLADAVQDTDTHLLRQRVDGRIVDRQDRDVTVGGELDHGVDGCHGRGDYPLG